MTSLAGLEDTLRKWHVPVIVNLVPGYQGRSFVPSWVMLHHTGSGMPEDGPAPNSHVVRTGRPDVPGPLCHLLVRRDLRVELVTRGRANHAGAGRWTSPLGSIIGEDDGNRTAVGIEIEHNGTAREAWTDEYVAFCYRVAAATLDHIGRGPDRLVAHKEYAPTRKIDPFRWRMDIARHEVARILMGGQPRPGEGDQDMQANDKIGLGPSGKRVLNQPDGVITYAEAVALTTVASVEANRLLNDVADRLDRAALHIFRTENPAHPEVYAIAPGTMKVEYVSSPRFWDALELTGSVEHIVSDEVWAAIRDEYERTSR